MFDKKNSVLFTDTECVVLSPDFKLLDENYVLFKVPRKDNMCSVDLKNIVPFRGDLVTILNTIRFHLVSFNGKADEGFFVGYSTNSKAFRVFNSRTRIVEENLHVKFSEETPNIEENRPNWLFDIDALTISMNYKPVVAGNQPNGNAGTKENFDAGQDGKKIVPDQSYILLPLLTSDPSLSKSSKDSPNAGFKPSREEEKMESKHPENEDIEVSNTEEPRVNQDHDQYIENNVVDEYIVYGCIDDPYMPNLEEIVYSDNDEEVGAEADINNLATTVPVTPQTRRMTKNVTEHVEPKKVIQALTDPSWIEAMQDELLQFNLQKVWTLVDLTYGKRAIGTKWVYRNKKDDRVARIEAIRLFLAYASFMNFIVYQMDVKCAFLYGTIEEEVYVCQPLGFEDPEFPNKVYKVEKALYGLHQAPRACVGVKQKDDGIFISQDKYMADILKKFDFATVKTANTPIETNKALLKDEEAADVDVHLYRSMIGSLMYLTASRPDIMFTVCACASDYAGASLDRKSTTRAEYVFAANCCGQVLWIQNQLLDYGYNFMNTKIFINNESTICIVKNPVFHSKTKNIEIRHHFIRDSYEKRLIQVIKIHIDHNVTDLLTKAFDVSKFQYLIPNETVYKEWEDKMERAATTASSLEVEQDNEAQTRFEAASKQSNDPPLSRVNTLRSGKDNMKLKELMELCTKLSKRILDNKNKLSELVRKRNERYSESKNRKRAFNVVRLNLLLPVLVYAARHSLTAVRHKLMLPGITSYCWLDDAEGTNCLPTATIFAELERMGYENLTQKLTFYKAYFSS
ncbi:putative ribonuclease H-like domain-containing protein [Tanacetum coccineum]